MFLKSFQHPFPWNDEDGKEYRTKPFGGHEYTVCVTREMGLVDSVRTWNNADITFVYSQSKPLNKIISSNLSGWAIREGKGDHDVQGIYAIYSLLYYLSEVQLNVIMFLFLKYDNLPKKNLT